MSNPFAYGTVVTGEAFCNRQCEIQQVVRAVENSDRLFIFSERRFGKTSLIHHSLAKLSKRKYLIAYVDLWPTDDETSFVTATAKAVTEATATTAKKILETAKSYFTLLAPSITLDNKGKPQIDFGVRQRSKLTPELNEVLAAPAKIATKGKKQAVVVFDECQQILNYDSDIVERRLRSIIQHQKNVAYIFLGSRKHLVQQMFLEKSRPLYRSAGHFPLGPIAEKEWIPFLQKRFGDAKKKIDVDHAQSICQLTQGHPFYTQHLCHALWELVEPRGSVIGALIDEAVELLLQRENHAYTLLWESLTKNPQRFLKGLANEPPGIKPFASDFTRRYGLRAASNAQRAAQTLLERDVIDRENGSFVIVDRFFRLWIQRLTA